MLIAIPAATTLLPFEWQVKNTATGTVLTQIAVLAWGASGTLNAGSVDVTPVNLRTDSEIVSACTCSFYENGGGTAMTIAGIIWYGGYASTTTAVDDESQSLAPLAGRRRNPARHR